MPPPAAEPERPTRCSEPMFETNSESPIGSQPIDLPAKKNSSCPLLPPDCCKARRSRRKQMRPTIATQRK
eukprot:scaffold155640_cov30-Tisochrysis_lutea.AAC.2